MLKFHFFVQKGEPLPWLVVLVIQCGQVTPGNALAITLYYVYLGRGDQLIVCALMCVNHLTQRLRLLKFQQFHVAFTRCGLSEMK